MKGGMARSAGSVKVLAVASGGGHWVQLMRLRKAWEGCDIAYATTDATYADKLNQESADNGRPLPRFYLVTNANRWQKFRLVRQLIDVSVVVFREKPDVIISTGAAPGYFALRIGRMVGARTIWLDSIANAQTMSLAGVKVAKYADLWLTQWEDLTSTQSRSGRSPQYWGSVM